MQRRAPSSGEVARETLAREEHYSLARDDYYCLARKTLVNGHGEEILYNLGRETLVVVREQLSITGAAAVLTWCWDEDGGRGGYQASQGAQCNPCKRTILSHHLCSVLKVLLR